MSETTIYQLERDVAEQVREEAKEIKSDRYYDDRLREIADSHVPIYNADRVECLLSDLSLAEAEDPGGIEGVTNIFDILAWTIYERLIAAAYEAYEEVKDYVYLKDTIRDKEYECEDSDEADEKQEELARDLAEYLVTQPEFELEYPAGDITEQPEDEMTFELAVYYKKEEIATIYVVLEEIPEGNPNYNQLDATTQEEILEAIVEYINDNDWIERDE